MFGAKGAGEYGVVGAPPAIAVADALGEYGVRHLDVPICSEQVWRLISLAKRVPGFRGLGKLHPRRQPSQSTRTKAAAPEGLATSLLESAFRSNCDVI
jgi:hypothetical protein